MPAEGKYPGLYRGIVVENDDRPTRDGGKAEKPVGDDKGPLGRVQVNVPQVYGNNIKPEELPWAEVAYPFGGGPDMEEQRRGGIFFVPQKGTTVWVAFEHGDIQRPVVVGQWFGKSADKVEIPVEARGQSRGPYADEKDRTGTEYPKIFAIVPPGQKDASPSMCLRFVDDKRVDLILDQNNWIELDDHGSPQESSPDLQDKMIRVHSSDRRIAITSNFDDPKAILLLANAGGIQIEAQKDIVIASRGGGIGMIAGTATASASAAEKIARAAEDDSEPNLNPAEQLSVGVFPLPGPGNIAITGEGQLLEFFIGTITHFAERTIAVGLVGGGFYHGPGLICAGHPG